MMFTHLNCSLLALLTFSSISVQAAHLRNLVDRQLTQDKKAHLPQRELSAATVFGDEEPTEKPIPRNAAFKQLQDEEPEIPIHSDYSNLLGHALEEYETSETAKEFAESHETFFTEDTILGLTRPSVYLKAIKFPGVEELTDEMCDNLDSFYGVVAQPANRKLDDSDEGMLYESGEVIPYDSDEVMGILSCQKYICTIPLNVVLQPIISIGGSVTSALVLKLGVVLAPFTGGSSAALAILGIAGIKLGVIITNTLIAKLIDHICCEL